MRNFLTIRNEKALLIDCDHVSQRKRDCEIHLDQDDRTCRPSSRREKREGGWPVDVARPARDRHCIPDPRARVRGSSSSNHQLPIRRVDSWKHGSRSKISGPSMAPPPSPYMATSRAYTRLLRKRDIESKRKRGEKKGNNNNRSLLGTSWSRARSSSWNLSTNSAIGPYSRNHYSRINGGSLH